MDNYLSLTKREPANLIDPLVNKAGWNLSDHREVAFEVPIDGYRGGGDIGND